MRSDLWGARHKAARYFVALIMAIGFLMAGSNLAYAVETETVAGENRYETAALQAVKAFPSGCEVVIVTSGDAWADALSAAGLAGALDCPILFTKVGSLPETTKEAIGNLGVKHAVIVGGVGCVSEAVEGELEACGINTIDRAAGSDRYETQLAVYEYGRSGYDGNNHWGNEVAIIASGLNFPDALSAASLAFSQKSPVFIVGSDGILSVKQDSAIFEMQPKRAIVLGGEACVANETLGYMRGVTAAFSEKGEPDAVRLAGDSRYDTSAAIAEWCVDEGYLNWEGAAFTVGSLPYDALAGSVVQGKKKSVLLLLDDAATSTIGSLVGGSTAVNSISYFGSTALIPEKLRSYIELSLEEGKPLPMGGSMLSTGELVWCDIFGAEVRGAQEYDMWFDRASRYTSATDWMIIVDTVRNELIIFRNYAGEWIIDKHWQCSTGAWATPTVKGEFTIGSRGLSFGSGFTCWYWTQFYGDYLFHSVTYNPGSMTSIQEGQLGINISHGCVRLEINNAKWIYDNIPTGSKVVVY